MSIDKRGTLIEVGDSRNRGYQPALDYLRALAAITVVVYHVTVTYRGYNGASGDWLHTSWPLFWNPLLIYFVEGHTAVTLFMVLSGYVLTRGTVSKNIEYGNFIINRILRIFPLYAFVTIYGISIHPEVFTLSALIQTILPFANVPGSLQSEVLTALFWSVAVEFQFYFVFPFIKNFMDRYGISYAASLLALFLIFRMMATAYHVDMQHFIYTTIFGRMDQFVIGMALAFIPARRWWSHQAALPLTAVAMLAILMIYHRLGGYPIYEWWKLLWPMVEALGWAAVIAASVYSPYRMPSLARQILVFVANMSFSIYVMHSTVLQIIGERHLYLHFTDHVYANAMLNSILFIPPVLALSWVTYRCIERPFMELRRRYVAAP